MHGIRVFPRLSWSVAIEIIVRPSQLSSVSISRERGWQCVCVRKRGRWPRLCTVQCENAPCSHNWLIDWLVCLFFGSSFDSLVLLIHFLVLWFLGLVGSLVRWFVDSAIHWFVDSMIRWLVDSLILWFTESIISLIRRFNGFHWFIGSLIRLFVDTIYWLVRWFFGSFFRRFVDSRIQGFTDSRIRWFTDSRIHWFTDSRTHWFTDSRIHWFSDSLIHEFTD